MSPSLLPDVCRETRGECTRSPPQAPRVPAGSGCDSRAGHSPQPLWGTARARLQLLLVGSMCPGILGLIGKLNIPAAASRAAPAGRWERRPTTLC